MDAKRYAGKLKQWSVERGFGFIVSDDSGQDLFVHISSFPRDGTQPLVGEPLTFEVVPDGTNKKRAVRVQRGSVVQPIRSRAHPPQPARLSRSPARQGFGSRIVVVLILVGLGAFGYKHYEARSSPWRATSLPAENNDPAPPVQLLKQQEPPRSPSKPLVIAPPEAKTNFQCDGRSRCNQMTSCQEATLFLKNCLGMQMDGNHDGIPCEEQWCH
jgi:cold shock CspA family protein